MVGRFYFHSHPYPNASKLDTMTFSFNETRLRVKQTFHNVSRQGRLADMKKKKNRLLTYFSLVVKLAFVALDNYPGTCKWDDWVVLKIDRAHVLQFSVDLRRFFFR